MAKPKSKATKAAAAKAPKLKDSQKAAGPNIKKNGRPETKKQTKFRNVGTARAKKRVEKLTGKIAKRQAAFQKLKKQTLAAQAKGKKTAGMVKRLNQHNTHLKKLFGRVGKAARVRKAGKGGNGG